MPPSQSNPLVQKVVAEPQHFVPPSPRELRAQAVHRLQVGLFGLAAMLLLVGLANIIMDQAKRSDPSPVVAATESGAKTADPLADIGVVPSPEPGADATRAAPANR